jgi:hypothetical protein
MNGLMYEYMSILCENTLICTYCSTSTRDRDKNVCVVLLQSDRLAGSQVGKWTCTHGQYTPRHRKVGTDPPLSIFVFLPDTVVATHRRYRHRQAPL